MNKTIKLSLVLDCRFWLPLPVETRIPRTMRTALRFPDNQVCVNVDNQS